MNRLIQCCQYLVVLFVARAVCWNLRIIVLGYERPRILYKCLQTLNSVNYLGHSIPLDVLIDGPPKPKTIISYLLARFLFEWRHGEKRVILNTRNIGSFHQWLHAWNPEWSSQEAALIVEDDVLVSPIFYSFLQNTLQRNTDVSSLVNGVYGVYGVALQRAQWQLGMTEKLTWRRLDLVDDSNHPRLIAYPAVGTWGQVFFPQSWISFKHWLRHQNINNRRIIWDGLIHEKWKLERGGQLWSYWFTRYALETQSFNLYYNLPNGSALAVSTREKGKYQKHSLGSSQSLFTISISGVFNLTDKVYFYDGCFEQLDDKLERQEVTNYTIHCHYKPGRYPHIT